MIKALMVDVDGVVVRGRPDDGEPWSSRLQQDLGLGVEILQTEFFQRDWQDVVLGRAPLRDRLAARLSVIAPDLPVERVISYWFAQDARLDEGLLADLAEIRAGGLSMYLATNQEHERAGYLWRTLGLGDRFDGMVYSAELGCGKPDRAFFAAAARHVDRSAPELLLIDDNAENIDCARAAGWNAAHWTGRQRLPDVLRTFDL